MTTLEHFAAAHAEYLNALHLKMRWGDIQRRLESAAHWSRILELESRTAPDGVVDPLIRSMTCFKPISMSTELLTDLLAEVEAKNLNTITNYRLRFQELAKKLEQTQDALRLALERVVREIARDKGTEAFKILPILEAAVTTSRSLLAAEHQEQYARTST